jgi:hypothetical protein
MQLKVIQTQGDEPDRRRPARKAKPLLHAL